MTIGRINLNTQTPRDPWEALDAIRERVAVSARPPNSFTIAEYAERYGMNERTAADQLKHLERAGQLKKQVAIVNSKRANVYWIPETETKPKPKGKQ